MNSLETVLSRPKNQGISTIYLLFNVISWEETHSLKIYKCFRRPVTFVTQLAKQSRDGWALFRMTSYDQNDVFAAHALWRTHETRWVIKWPHPARGAVYPPFPGATSWYEPWRPQTEPITPPFHLIRNFRQILTFRKRACCVFRKTNGQQEQDLKYLKTGFKDLIIQASPKMWRSAGARKLSVSHTYGSSDFGKKKKNGSGERGVRPWLKMLRPRSVNANLTSLGWCQATEGRPDSTVTFFRAGFHFNTCLASFESM